MSWSGSDRISPTAHYTGYVWVRNGLSHPRLATPEGRVLFEALRGVMAASVMLGGNSLERYLLARHRSIDRLLEAALESGRVSQVVEVAAGMSGRGWRFSSRYGEGIDYLEADLPAMAGRKRRVLAEMGSLSDHHRVVDLDALGSAGPDSLAGVAAGLDPKRGTAIITEGLLGYLDTPAVLGLWRRVAEVLHGFEPGVYLSDLHLGAVADLPVRAFRLLLSAFVRGNVHLHFDQAPDAVRELGRAGFQEAVVRPATAVLGTDERGGEQMVHIIEASTVRSQ